MSVCKRWTPKFAAKYSFSGDGLKLPSPSPFLVSRGDHDHPGQECTFSSPPPSVNTNRQLRATRRHKPRPLALHRPGWHVHTWGVVSGGMGWLIKIELSIAFERFAYVVALHVSMEWTTTTLRYGAKRGQNLVFISLIFINLRVQTVAVGVWCSLAIEPSCSLQTKARALKTTRITSSIHPPGLADDRTKGWQIRKQADRQTDSELSYTVVMLPLRTNDRSRSSGDTHFGNMDHCTYGRSKKGFVWQAINRPRYRKRIVRRKS